MSRALCAGHASTCLSALQVNANLALNLLVTPLRRPEHIALRSDGAALSYADLDDLSARVAGLLRDRGVSLGDRVGIMLPNVPQFAAVYYGILRAGGVVVPMNILLKQREVAFYLGDSGANLIFAWHDMSDGAEAGARQAGSDCIKVHPDEFDELLTNTAPIAEFAFRSPSDTAVILYTSGTTGTPKGAELTHANLSRNAEVSRQLFRLDESSVVLGVLPLFHSFGQTCSLNATVVAGGTLTLLPRFDACKTLQVIERDRVDVFMGVPTMVGALIGHPAGRKHDTSSLRLAVSGGASLPVEVLRGFERTFKCPILEGYGLSETSPAASFNHLGRERKPGSIGTPVEGVEMKVVDEDGNDLPVGSVGEIVIRGHNVMKGYWRRPDATAEAITADGWFRTGDLARVDTDGYFFIVDRKKDMIIRGGLNVYPREIEEVIYEHGGVQEAAVVGLHHPDLGEEVGAAVVRRPGAEVTEDDLRSFVKERVAAYKYPRRIWFVDELPKSATGKILKREIVPPAVV